GSNRPVANCRGSSSIGQYFLGGGRHHSGKFLRPSGAGCGRLDYHSCERVGGVVSLDNSERKPVVRGGALQRQLRASRSRIPLLRSRLDPDVSPDGAALVAGGSPNSRTRAQTRDRGDWLDASRKGSKKTSNVQRP